MGIKNLLKVLREHAPNSIREVTIADIRGYKVAVDASIMLYQLANIGNSRGIRNPAGKQINHIQGALSRAAALCEAGVSAIYVFDGVPPDTKHRRPQSEVSKAGDSLSRMSEEVIFTFQTVGIPYIVAQGEAEAQCAHMTHGEVDTVITEDTDAIAFGAKKVLFGYGVAGTKKMVLVDTENLLQEMGLTREAFIDLCILLGSDYSSTIPGIGPKRAVALIKQHGSIEALLPHLAARHRPGPGFVPESARKILTNPLVSNESIPATGRFALETASAALIDRFGLNPRKTANTLHRIANCSM